VVLQTKTSVIVLLLGCVLMLSCGNRKKSMDTVSINADTLPMMHSESIVSLISQEGITKYRMQAQVLDVYSNDSVSYWHFPKGAFMEEFDSLLHVSGSVKADTVYMYDKQSLWKLVGNVVIQTTKGETFLTSLLFFNQKEPPWSLNAVYTDSLVEIHKPGSIEVLFSKGIRANQSMSKYTFYQNYAELLVEESE
jgi:LPS export ABC transporter protein LptC